MGNMTQEEAREWLALVDKLKAQNDRMRTIFQRVIDQMYDEGEAKDKIIADLKNRLTVLRNEVLEAYAGCAALSVPCLQEPVRYVSSRDGSVITPAHFDSIISKKDHFTPLYAHPVEVREQAIRECAEAIDELQLNSLGLVYEQETIDDCKFAILALLEGR